MMTIKEPKFRQGATTTELFYGALEVETEGQADACMRGLADYFRYTYPAYYGDKSAAGLRLIIWTEIKRYAVRNGLPIAGLHRYYKIPARIA